MLKVLLCYSWECLEDKSKWLGLRRGRNKLKKKKESKRTSENNYKKKEINIIKKLTNLQSSLYTMSQRYDTKTKT